MARRPGLSARQKLTISYIGFVVGAGMLLLAVVWLFLLRYVPEDPTPADGFVPSRSDLVQAFAPRLALALSALLVVVLVGGWLLARRMLAPLARITEASRAAAAGSLTHRIRMPGRRDEFRELADTFDTMLSRIEEHVTEQQRFAANASHELRTPLAITKTLLEVAADDPHHDPDALRARLAAVNARAIALTEALLVLSRAGQRSFERESVDLSLLAEDAAETLLPQAERAGVDLEVTGVAATALGSPALLRQLATNLVHNAIVHNAASTDGPERWVHVTTMIGPGTATLVVENTGDVVDDELVATLTEAFQRGSGRVHTHSSGVGLGLAIVKTIAEAHDGSLTLKPRASGGLRVTVQLPRAGGRTA